MRTAFAFRFGSAACRWPPYGCRMRMIAGTAAHTEYESSLTRPFLAEFTDSPTPGHRTRSRPAGNALTLLSATAFRISGSYSGLTLAPRPCRRHVAAPECRVSRPVIDAGSTTPSGSPSDRERAVGTAGYRRICEFCKERSSHRPFRLSICGRPAHRDGCWPHGPICTAGDRHETNTERPG